jgi:hypothetical protein
MGVSKPSHKQDHRHLSTLYGAYTPAIIPTTITCTVSKATAKENEQITVSGTINADVPAVVTIQKSVDTSWATQTTTTSTHGAYSATISLTEGSYIIRATWPGDTTHATATSPQTTLNITPRTGTLKITILDDKNNPRTGATITTTKTPTGQAALQGTTATDGTATFTDTRIGDYTINASKTGYKTNTDTAEVKENQTTSKTIKLTPNGIPGFPVEAIALGVILYLGYFILFRINKKKINHFIII